MKKCRQCRKEKSLTEYHKDSSAKDKMRVICKICVNKNQRKNTRERKAQEVVKVGSNFEIEQSKKLKKLTSKYNFRFSNKDILDLEKQFYNRG
jgi:superfamily II helicase